MGAGAQPAAAQRLPPLHRRPAPLGDGGQRRGAGRRGRAPRPARGRRAAPRPRQGLPGRPHRGRHRARRAHRAAHGLRPTTTRPCWRRWCATTCCCPTWPPGATSSDDATIEAVAEAVGEPLVLELLAALTEADSLATGPSAWGTWKAELVGRAGRPGRRSGSAAGPTGAAWTLFPSAEVLALMGAGRTVVLPGPDRVTVVTGRPARPVQPRRRRAVAPRPRRARRAGPLRRPGHGGLRVPGGGRRHDRAGSVCNATSSGRSPASSPSTPAWPSGPAPTPAAPPRPQPAGAAACGSTTTRRRTPPSSRCGRPTASACSTASPRPWPTWLSTSATPASRPSATRWSTRSTCAIGRGQGHRSVLPGRDRAGRAVRRVRGLTPPH